MASRAFARASSRDSPWVHTPGRSGTETTNPPSSVRSKTTSNCRDCSTVLLCAAGGAIRKAPGRATHSRKIARVVGVATFADQLFFVTAYLEGSSNGDSWSGTGFCFAVESDQGTVHLLVSNKHVLSNVSSLRIRMVAPGGDQPKLGAATQIDVEGAASMVVGHPDPAVDVAVMPLSPVLEHMAKNGAAPFFRSVSPEICLTKERERDLDSIEEVQFVGYPNALFDVKHFTPIARRGTTATPIQLDYRGEPAFLVDATVFPGSSGSPVFLSDTGTYRSREER